MEMFTAILLTADLALGRFCLDDLPDQGRMEMLVNDIMSNKDPNDFTPHIFSYSEGAFGDVCSWECVFCDQNDNVHTIEWEGLEWISGAQNFEFVYLPRALRILSLSLCDISGNVEWDSLPRGLNSVTLWIIHLRGL